MQDELDNYEYFSDPEIADEIWQEDQLELQLLRRKVREQGIGSLSIAENSRWGTLEERALDRGEPVSSEFQAIYDKVRARRRRL